MAQIMVVEDEGLVALEIKGGLEKMGYTVPDVISNGNEAIRRALTEQPDLVLMDIRLDGSMDGIEAARQIRENFFVPVIFLTAHSDIETLQRAKLAESYGYLLKPFDDRALNAAIEIALYKSAEEKKNKRNREWLSMVLHSIGEGVIVSDIKGIIKYLNENAKLLLECAGCMENTRLVDLFRLCDKKTGKSMNLPLEQPIIQGSVVNRKCVLIVQNEVRKDIEFTIGPLKNSNNTTIGLIIVFKMMEKDTILKNDAIMNELETPKKIQKSLLPKNGQIINGLKMNWVFHSSTFGSGDIFNFFALDDDYTGFYLLDVMGSGFSAALFSTTLYKFLSPDLSRGGILKSKKEENPNHPMRRKSDLLPNIITPSRVIAELNKRFYFEGNTNPFFTMVYGIINTKKKRITVARAGHIPPVLQKKDGIIIELHSKGYAIGIFGQMEITEEEVDFDTGDRLFLFSDGLLGQAENCTDRISSEDLTKIIGDCKDMRTHDLLKLVESRAIQGRENSVPDDDVAIISIEMA
jgi:serine phosphatase RsbU (regulator of sigma subunit)/CheY-like chemotaxis protein